MRWVNSRILFSASQRRSSGTWFLRSLANIRMRCVRVASSISWSWIVLWSATDSTLLSQTWRSSGSDGGAPQAA